MPGLMPAQVATRRGLLPPGRAFRQPLSITPVSLRNPICSESSRGRGALQVRAAGKAAIAKAAVAKAAAAAAAAGPTPLVPLSWAIAVPSVYCAVLLLLMLLAPGWHRTQQLIRSNWVYVPVALLYVLLLINSWQPDTLGLMLPGSLDQGLKGFNPQFFPQLDGVAELFSRPVALASFCVHVLFINTFLARSIYLDGLRTQTFTAHSILASTVFGPLGMLCHLLTQGAYALFGMVLGRDLHGRPQPTVLESNSGSIVIMPTEE